MAQPRHQFILDLQAWLEEKINNNHEIILGIDANETYDPDTPGASCPLIYKEGIPTFNKLHDGTLKTLVSSCGLQDSLAFQHSSRPFPASHIRGSSRIDFIFVTSGISSSAQSSGSMSFHSIFHSDYRAYYVDFSSSSLFADPAYEIPPHSYRKLQLQDPRITDEYRTALYDQLKAHNVFQWIENLWEIIAQGTWQPQHTEVYSVLDSTITEAMLSTENRTGKRYSTKFEWSPTLKRAVESHLYWYLRLKKARHPTLSAAVIHAHHSRLELPPTDINLTFQDIVIRLKESAQTLKQYQHQHSHLHASFNSLQEVRSTRAQKELKQLIQREAMRKSYRKIGTLLNPNQQQGLSSVDVPDLSTTSLSHGNPNDPSTWTGPWLQLTNHQQIAQAIKEANRKQYHQAYATPFGSGPLATAMGRAGVTAAAQNLLKGVLPSMIPNISPETSRVLDTLAKPYDAVLGTATITEAEFIDTCKVANESTSSSPSGRHMGHYKAVLQGSGFLAFYHDVTTISGRFCPRQMEESD
jgi:hypothetical protein